MTDPDGLAGSGVDGSLPEGQGASGIVHHASRMAVVTLVSRLTGYLRDKTLSYVLGAGVMYDAFITATRIPSTFRMLLGEGALHAAFIPTLTRLKAEGKDGDEARDLVRGVLAALLLILATVVSLGILASPWLVRAFALGFASTPGKLQLAVLLNRLVFPYLMLVSLAALCQGVLNSHDKFLLPAAAPILYNLSVVGVVWMLVRHSRNPVPYLAVAVLLGGLLQFLVQARSVRRLGYSLRPAWRLATGPQVRKVLLLMLPGIPMLGVNQLNQLVSNFFASFAGNGGVVYTFASYRVTELVFGAIVVQLTTVLLPTLSRHLTEDTQKARTTLLETLAIVSYVTLPAATVMAILGRPVIGLLFGGGRFTQHDVVITGATLTAYAFGVVGTGHAKVLANAFFAHQDTKTPMFGSLLLLGAFTAGCALLAGRLGTPGIGLANTIAMLSYAVFLTVLYARRHGFGPVGNLLTAGGRQIVASAVLAGGLLWVRPWLAPVMTTSIGGALRMAAVLAPATVLYVALVAVLGGSELATLRGAVRRRKTL